MINKNKLSYVSSIGLLAIGIIGMAVSAGLIEGKPLMTPVLSAFITAICITVIGMKLHSPKLLLGGGVFVYFGFSIKPAIETVQSLSVYPGASLMLEFGLIISCAATLLAVTAALKKADLSISSVLKKEGSDS